MVATPLGNLGDITLRAIETLKKVSLVAAEDTRRARALLTHLEIRAKLISCRARNETGASAKVVAALENGEEAAYVSDAGTPALSDPGAELARRAAEAGEPPLLPQRVQLHGVGVLSSAARLWSRS